MHGTMNVKCVTLPIVNFASSQLVALLCTAALHVDGWPVEVMLCVVFAFLAEPFDK
jgi:hypothetical protein